MFAGHSPRDRARAAGRSLNGLRFVFLVDNHVIQDGSDGGRVYRPLALEHLPASQRARRAREMARGLWHDCCKN